MSENPTGPPGGKGPSDSPLLKAAIELFVYGPTDHNDYK